MKIHSSVAAPHCRALLVSLALVGLAAGGASAQPASTRIASTRIASTRIASTGGADSERVAFFVAGDPQYLAEKSPEPTKLDPYSEEANARFIELLRSLPGSQLPEAMGGQLAGAEALRGIVVVGDLIDSLDKRGGDYPAMQRFEFARFLADYGLAGGDGRIAFPVYELHGNHDGPQGDTFLVRQIIERNRTRPAVVYTSQNGLHYSWDWGPLHLVNLGIIVGEGDEKREGHHYAARGSLEFLREDLERNVGSSGRPVAVAHHLQLNASDYDWPEVDRRFYHAALAPYNVIAVFNGHTHRSPPLRQGWDGQSLGPEVEGLDNYDPDDAGAAKLDKKTGKPVGLAHGVLYAELHDRPGTERDEFVVRAYRTTDNWTTGQWHARWSKPLVLPTEPAGTIHELRVEAPDALAAPYRLWWPEGLERARFVLAVNQRGAGPKLFADREWRRFVAEQGGAMLFCGFEAPEVETNGAGLSMLLALEDFATATAHPELAKAPLVLWGHSMGGRVAQNFARFAHERALALIIQTRAFESEAAFMDQKLGDVEVPGLYLLGASDRKPADIREHFEYARARAAPRTWLWLPGESHWPRGMSSKEDRSSPSDWRAWTHPDLVFEWLEGVIAARLGGEGELRPIDTRRGWLGAVDGGDGGDVGEVATWSDFGSERARAAWLPNEATAKRWRRTMLRGGRAPGPAGGR